MKLKTVALLKILLVVILITASMGWVRESDRVEATGMDYYVSLTGDDNNGTGTINAHLRRLVKQGM
ncbi:hypothetical protein GC102_21495 [Paenibacillus sp. LMG 31460]|uniref:Uncharacterized protein n=1 Tax=Paenibacillus germinis TaxID=2654979 RepID=A0ABX1Z4K8_9BACL|nr:hypothetical protein [Paenibacillus germinis]NOU88315.1 hypothetical protein [Paenibacillus germinis]